MPKRSLVVLVLLAGPAAADDVFLKSGGQLSGRIVGRTDTSITVDVGAGRITVPASSVVRVQEGRSALQEYEERAARLGAGDVPGWLELAAWASAHGLGTQSRQAYERALQAAPNDPNANEALGRVQLNGRWVSEEESYRARGYVEYGGDWVTPAERDAMERAREAESQRDRERLAAEARAREAEERAAEAEKRAQEAQAQQEEGLPLWYGWGAGPVAWPTGPIVVPSRPVVRPRPVTR